MVWIARFSAKAPPRLSRCRTVRPLLAGSGLIPPKAANAASLRHRPGWENDTMACAALTGPTPRRSVRPGARSLTMACSWARLVLSARGTIAEGEGKTADLGVPHGLLTAGLARCPAPGKVGEDGVSERAPGQATVGVVPTTQEQRA